MIVNDDDGEMIVHEETCLGLTDLMSHRMQGSWVQNLGCRVFDTPDKVHKVVLVYSWILDEDISFVFAAEDGVAVGDEKSVDGVSGVMHGYHGVHRHVDLKLNRKSWTSFLSNSKQRQVERFQY